MSIEGGYYMDIFAVNSGVVWLCIPSKMAGIYHKDIFI